MTARIFVTGATDWTDDTAIARVLERAVKRFVEAGFVLGEIVLIAGVDDGAEHAAVVWWENNHLPFEWSVSSPKQYQKRAPYIRNYTVIQSSPELVLIFGQSKHSDHALQLARAADIETVHIE